MPKAWSNKDERQYEKDERQYEHVKSSESQRGRSTSAAKRIAAATVNKQRRSEGRTRTK